MAEQGAVRDEFADAAALHLRVLRFESKTGGFNDPEKDFELDPVNTKPEGGSGFVRYERTDAGWEVTFHDESSDIVFS